ncbi:MAG: glycosyltransferase family 4 protein [Rhodothermales bacterium]
MPLTDTLRVGYVVKRYPRFSETFIVNEILAHEKAGLDLDIFALRPPVDTHFQPAIARVRAEVTYLRDKGKMSDLWEALRGANEHMPSCQTEMLSFDDEQVGTVYQALQLATAVKEKGINHLHAHFATSAATVARMAAALAGITYTFTAHAKDIFHESVVEADLRKKLQDASSTITVSDFNVEYLQEKYGPAAQRVVRIFNGIELDRFQYKAPSERPPCIVAVGRLVEKKGFSCLIDACDILADRGIAFKCQIIGEGMLYDQLNEQIKEVALSHCIELVGPRPQSEIAGLLQNAAVFAAPCVIGKDGNRDGLPTVLLESMALGTPCISTDVTGIPEILHDEETGLLVPQEDAMALADAIERLINHGSLRVRLAEKARQLIEMQFDIHRNAERIRKHFTPRLFAGDTLPSHEITMEQEAQNA